MGPDQQQGEDWDRDLLDEAAARRPETSPETSIETSLESLNLETSPQTRLESLNLETCPQTRSLFGPRSQKAHMDPGSWMTAACPKRKPKHKPKSKVPRFLHDLATYMRTNDAWARYLAREMPVTTTDYELLDVYLSVSLWGEPGERWTQDLSNPN